MILKSLWYHRMHIVLDDFYKLYMTRIIFIQFQCDYMRFQTLSATIGNRRLKSWLTRFYVISYNLLWVLWLHSQFRTKWFNDFTCEWPLGIVLNFINQKCNKWLNTLWKILFRRIKKIIQKYWKHFELLCRRRQKSCFV